MIDQDGAHERFREVVMPHLAAALIFARWLTGSSHDAEDVVQEACIRALRGIDTFDGRNSRGWVFAIVRNTGLNWLAKYRSKTAVLADDLTSVDEDAELVDVDDALSPEAELIRKADVAAVEASIAALPHLFREPLVLRDISGLSYKEIAATLELPIGTVMSRLARARARLAQSIASTQQ